MMYNTDNIHLTSIDLQLHLQMLSSMKVSFCLALLTSLLVSSCSLHLMIHQSLTDYLNLLKANQQSLINNINNLNSTIITQDNAINQQSDQLARIKLLESLITTEREQITSFLPLTSIPLNSSGWICQGLSSDQQNTLKATLTNISTGITQLQNIISSNPNITNYQSVSDLAKDTLSTDQRITNDINSNGQTVSTAPPILNQSNLLPGNWVTGNESIPAIQNQYTNNANQYINLCPSQSPYLDSTNTCIACSTYFNLQTKKCIQCTNYDAANHICNDPPAYTTTNANAGKAQLLLPPNTTIDSVSQLGPSDLACPTATPFFDGSKCISCPILFDYANKICTQCPPGSTYLPNTYSCSPVSINVTNPNNLTNLLLPNNETIAQYNTNQQNAIPNGAIPVNCPLETPFFNGNTCQGCSQGLLYSVTTKSCLTCPSGQFYNPNTYHCQNAVQYSNLANPNWVTYNQSVSAVQGSIQNQSTIPGSQVCPTSQPFYNGSACISCVSPSNIFNFTSQSCIQCPIGTLFSINTHKCEQATLKQTNTMNAPNLILDGRSKSEWNSYYYNNITANPAISDCPTATPFFDGITCISCDSSTPYFNLQYRVCQKCQVDTTYDAQFGECMSTSGNIVNQSPTLQKMAAGIFS